jgi:glutamate/tyrosine decarboxylase-like PLP-dependent enzyme
MHALLAAAAARAQAYLDALDGRRVAPSPADLAGLAALDTALPAGPTDPAAVLALLDDAGSPATVASAGGRYFGFVTGGSLPAALAANWLAGAWDQMGGSVATSPVVARLEDIARVWLLDLLQLPPASGVGFVTGATMANFACLAAARHALLARRGWDVEAQGLFGAPAIRVVVSEEAHVSLLNALAMVGFGRARIERVPVDDQGRMRADKLPALDAQTLLCLQAGNVNSGAFDPADALCAAARAAGSWTHVDGAFGLWAAAAPDLAHLTTGYALADSWAVDAHKWLNVPYDSGLAFCRKEKHLRLALSVQADYLQHDVQRQPYWYTPEMSRRARGVEVWAALRSLGRQGVAALVAGCCRHARRFAAGLTAAGYTVHNDVVLNQVVVSFGDDEQTRRTIAAIQDEGTTWAGATVWQGRTAMRISVSSWATTDADVARSLAAMVRIAGEQAAA